MARSPAPPAGCLNHRYDRVTPASVPRRAGKVALRSALRYTGYAECMSHEQSEQERIESRAQLLPEEVAAGSEDPEAQADAILTESDIREDTDVAEDTTLEHRTSDQTVTPSEPPD